MYTPQHFAITDAAALQRIMQAHPLGMLLTHGDAGLDAEHLPFEWEAEPGPHGRLLAHVARANPLWQRCPTGTPVMVVFRGVEAYISPNWYPSKQLTHRQVPTWNYEVVHAHGTLTIHDDQRFLRGVLARLTRRHEAAEPKPWKMGDAPVDYMDEMLRQIVGIEVTLHSVVGKAKLGQDESAPDRLGAIEQLQQNGHPEMAQRMSDNHPTT